MGLRNVVVRTCCLRPPWRPASSLSSCYQELAPGWASFIWFKYNLISGIACGFVYIILFHIFYDFSVCVCAFVSFCVVDCMCIHIHMYMQHIHMCVLYYLFTCHTYVYTNKQFRCWENAGLFQNCCPFCHEKLKNLIDFYLRWNEIYFIHVNIINIFNEKPKCSRRAHCQ